jgi:hypothetical protein
MRSWRTLPAASVVSVLILYTAVGVLRPAWIASPRSRWLSPPLIASLVVGSIAAIWIVLELHFAARTAWHNAKSIGGYVVLDERALGDGVEYWIAISHQTTPYFEIRQLPEPEWLSDQVDTVFIAADHSLKPITKRKWNIYQLYNHRKTKFVPPDRPPDWVMTWSNTGDIRISPESERGRRIHDELHRRGESSVR